MRLTARAMGLGIRVDEFAGAVAHVSRHVCLLALTDETLLTLATPAIGHLPRGITLECEAEFLLQRRLTKGQECEAHDGILRFSDTAFSIDLNGTPYWHCDLARLRLDVREDLVHSRWLIARAALREDGRSEGLQRLARSTIGRLAGAVRALDDAAAGEAAAGLVGLGEGATPAADDFLVGYVAGLLCSIGSYGARCTFASAFCKRIKCLASRTSRLSEHYLLAAAEGQISERLYALAVCISAGGSGSTVLQAAHQVLSVGHTSGACSVFGFLAGSAAWPQTMALADEFWK